MNKQLPLLVLLASALVPSNDGLAQCRKFSKQRIVNTLDADQSIDQIKVGTLGRGESAAAILEVEITGEVDLIISTHPDLGLVDYTVVNTSGKRIAKGTTRGESARMSIAVEAEQDLIVHIQSETAVGAYTPLGCVTLATTTPSPNEMDILTKE